MNLIYQKLNRKKFRYYSNIKDIKTIFPHKITGALSSVSRLQAKSYVIQVIKARKLFAECRVKRLFIVRLLIFCYIIVETSNLVHIHLPLYKCTTKSCNSEQTRRSVWIKPQEVAVNCGVYIYICRLCIYKIQ